MMQTAAGELPCSDGGGAAAPPPPKRAKLAPAEAAAAESEPARMWTCQECTFVNASATALQCEVCHSLRR